MTLNVCCCTSRMGFACACYARSQTRIYVYFSYLVCKFSSKLLNQVQTANCLRYIRCILSPISRSMRMDWPFARWFGHSVRSNGIECIGSWCGWKCNVCSRFYVRGALQQQNTLLFSSVLFLLLLLVFFLFFFSCFLPHVLYYYCDAFTQTNAHNVRLVFCALSASYRCCRCCHCIVVAGG